MNKNKKDYLTLTILCQFVVCVLLFGSMYGLKTMNSEMYNDLKKVYFNNLDKNFFVVSDEVVNVSEKEIETSSESVTKVETTTDEENNDIEQATKEETMLAAEITAKGGKDYAVKNNNDVPSNVSVNNYSLNQRMVNPVIGNITSDFGIRNHPITGELRFHAGVDIAASKGTPIYSSFDGTVVTSSYNKWNGNYLKIKHDNDIMTVYCHCEKLKVNKGDKVRAGDIIATVGSTGSSTGPHLHFEFRINNISYDPEIALKTAVDGI